MPIGGTTCLGPPSGTTCLGAPGGIPCLAWILSDLLILPMKLIEGELFTLDVVVHCCSLLFTLDVAPVNDEEKLKGWGDHTHLL